MKKKKNEMFDPREKKKNNQKAGVGGGGVSEIIYTYIYHHIISFHFFAWQKKLRLCAKKGPKVNKSRSRTPDGC